MEQVFFTGINIEKERHLEKESLSIVKKRKGAETKWEDSSIRIIEHFRWH